MSEHKIIMTSKEEWSFFFYLFLVMFLFFGIFTWETFAILRIDVWLFNNIIIALMFTIVIYIPMYLLFLCWKRDVVEYDLERLKIYRKFS